MTLTRRFEAETMADALRQVREHLGEDAMILETRRIQGGWPGFGQRQRVEVVAKAPPPVPPTLAMRDAPRERRIEAVAKALPPGPAIPARRESPRESRIENVAKAPIPFPASPTMSASRESPRENWSERFAASGMDSSLAGRILEASGPDPLPTRIFEEIVRKVTAAPESRSRVQTRMALVGPTGVGKTTTAAKLAARAAVTLGRRVALITMDTYRIGAVEQLRIYARIMGLSLEVAETPAEMSECISKHSDKDLVLIDTVGRSPRKSAQIFEVGAFLDAARPTEIHLTLAAPCDVRYLLNAAAQFAVLKPNRLIVTKLDEMPSWGLLPTLSEHTHLPLSFATDGQDVPRNLRKVVPQDVALEIFGGVG